MADPTNLDGAVFFIIIAGELLMPRLPV